MTPVPSRSVLAWHVRGSWMEAFVAGPHRCCGLCVRNWTAAQDIPVDRLRDQEVDQVVVQRPGEIALTAQRLARRPGVDVPAVHVEHNAPRPVPVDSGHPVSDRSDIPLIYAIDFNTDLPGATVAGKAAREIALAHCGLERFPRDWDRVLADRCS